MSTKGNNASTVKDNFCKHLLWKKSGKDSKTQGCDCMSSDVLSDKASKNIFRTKEQSTIIRSCRRVPKWQNQPKKIQTCIKTAGVQEESCHSCCTKHYKDLYAAERFKQRVLKNADLVTKGWAINTFTPLATDIDTQGKPLIYCNWDGYYAPVSNKVYLNKRADAYVCGCSNEHISNPKFNSHSNMGCGDTDYQGMKHGIRKKNQSRDSDFHKHPPRPAEPKYYSNAPGNREKNADNEYTGTFKADGTKLKNVWITGWSANRNRLTEGMKNYNDIDQRNYINAEFYSHRNHIRDKLKVFYINELQGNDSFGDGSIYNPYKSVNIMKEKFIDVDYIIKEDGDDDNGVGSELKPFRSLNRIREDIKGKDNVVFNVVVYLPKDFQLLEGQGITAGWGDDGADESDCKDDRCGKSVGSSVATGAAAGAAVGSVLGPLGTGVGAAVGSVIGFSAGVTNRHRNFDHKDWGGCWPVQDKAEEEAILASFNGAEMGSRGGALLAKMAGGQTISGAQGALHPTEDEGSDCGPADCRTKTPITNDPNVAQCPTYGEGGDLEGVLAEKRYGIAGASTQGKSARQMIKDVKYLDIDAKSKRSGAKGREPTTNSQWDTTRLRLCRRPKWQYDPIWKMRCCLDDKSGSMEGVQHTRREAQTCPRDYCYSHIQWSAIPKNEKMATAIANGGGMRAKGLRLTQWDPLLPKSNSRPSKDGFYRVMTKECHENFLQKCMEPWAPPNSKLTPIIGGHFFGGSSTWKCVPECNPKKGITTDCGPKCIEEQAKIDEAGIAGGEISPIAGMCRKWAFIQPRVFNESVAPDICKLPDKKYIDGMLNKLQNKDNKVGQDEIKRLKKVLEFPLCRDYFKRNFEKFKPVLTNMCSYMFKRNCTGKDPITKEEICTYPSMKEHPIYGWMPELNGIFGKMLHETQACGCHLPYSFRKERLEKEYKGHMKGMIAFKMAQNPMCSDDGCKTYGLGAPVSYLNVIDRCMCNLNVQICDQNIGDKNKDKKEDKTNRYSQPPAWRQSPSSINTQVCKFDKVGAGISGDDWTAMHQCGINSKKLKEMALVQEDLYENLKKQSEDIVEGRLADRVNQNLDTAQEYIEKCKPKGVCTTITGNSKLASETNEEYTERMKLLKEMDRETCVNNGYDWTPPDTCGLEKKECPDCGESECPCNWVKPTDKGSTNQNNVPGDTSTTTGDTSTTTGDTSVTTGDKIDEKDNSMKILGMSIFIVLLLIVLIYFLSSSDDKYIAQPPMVQGYYKM